MGLLDSIFSDPSSPGGGWLLQALQSLTGANKANPGLSTSTPTTPPPVQSPLGLPFAPRNGLLGNSLFGDAIRGGLAGLNGATGYSGFGAQLGAGAQAGTQALRQRQQFQMQNLLNGQQYLQGNQQLAQGNLSIAQAVANFNIWNQAINPNAPQITVSDVQGDPNKLAQIMSAPPNSGGSAAGASQPQTGMQPIYGGGTGGDPQVTQAYGPSLNGAGTPTQGAPQQTGDSTGLVAAFAQMHGGMTPQQWSALGFRMRNQGMIDEAAKYDPTLLTGVEKAKARGQTFVSKPGGALLSGETGNVVGSGNPIKTEILDPSGSGNMVPAIQYPDGRIELSGYTGGNAGSAGGGSSLNNPGNIKSGPNGTFGQYSSMGAGVDAIDQNLKSYGMKGINTVRGIISTWAPASDQNDTPTLIANAAKMLGVDPDKPLNMNDPNTRAQLAMAIMRQENGLSPANNSSVTGTNAGTSPVSKLGPYATETQEGWAKRRSELGEFADSGIQAEQRFQALADALKATQSGSFATSKGKVAAALRAAGIDLPDSVLGDPAALQIALKESTQGVFSQIKSLVGGRVAAQEINLLASASANPDLQPAANAKIIAQAIGAIRYSRDLYQQLSQQKNPTDPDQFEIQFQKDHPLQSYVDAAEKEIGPLKGMEAPNLGGGAPNALKPPPRVTDQKSYDMIGRGQQYLDPNGVLRTKQ